ncbi:hypothetical protein HanIR_Chr11g0512061 [Helianthus annuus]|nr:hypothetical protein HanIR_Chr11g0512061 [Helianthus annuus]
MGLSSLKLAKPLMMLIMTKSSKDDTRSSYQITRILLSYDY